jgi:hypothetical protein
VHEGDEGAAQAEPQLPSSSQYQFLGQGEAAPQDATQVLAPAASEQALGLPPDITMASDEGQPPEEGAAVMDEGVDEAAKGGEQEGGAATIVGSAAASSRRPQPAAAQQMKVSKKPVSSNSL